jgi:hypothetical protein
VSAPTYGPSRSAGRREVVLRIALPRLPACTAMLGTSGLGAALAHGAVPAAWPLVVLSLGAMAYDVGLRAVRRLNRPTTSLRNDLVDAGAVGQLTVPHMTNDSRTRSAHAADHTSQANHAQDCA